MHKYIIYGLVDPVSCHLRYIGKSHTGLHRVNQHFASYRLNVKTWKVNWIKSLLNKGLKPTVLIIQEFQEPEILSQSEIFWIDYFKKMGCPLTNMTIGGEGVIGLPRSNIWRKRMSESMKGKNAGSKSYNFNRPKTFNTLLKLSKSKGCGEPFICLNNNKVYYMQSEAAKDLNITAAPIGYVLRKERKHTKGFVFKFLKEF